MTNERTKSDYEQAQADGEYIPKQAVLENIDQWYEDKADIEDLIVRITYMQGVAIPNKAKPKHWIHRNDDYNDWLEYPNCGYGSEGEVKYGEGTPYCPYCGERLEEK